MPEVDFKSSPDIWPGQQHDPARQKFWQKFKIIRKKNCYVVTGNQQHKRLYQILSGYILKIRENLGGSKPNFCCLYEHISIPCSLCTLTVFLFSDRWCSVWCKVQTTTHGARLPQERCTGHHAVRYQHVTKRFPHLSLVMSSTEIDSTYIQFRPCYSSSLQNYTVF